MNSISTVEIGSTSQGLSDNYSDKDHMTLFNLTSEQLVFQNNKMHSAADANDGQHRYYTPQFFYKMITQKGLDGLIILSAQLNQASQTDFNKVALKSFDDEKFVRRYMLSINKNVVMSLNGLFYNNYKKYLKSQEINGKMLVDIASAMSRLKYFYELDCLKGDYNIYSIIVDSTRYDGYVEKFMPYKRETNQNKLNDVVKDITGKNVDEFLRDANNETHKIINEAKSWKNHSRDFDKLKKDFSKFILNDLLN